MALRSMTGFAQVKGHLPGPTLSLRDKHGAPDEGPEFTVSLKSVNHKFLDLHLRLPSDSDALEMKLRKLLKERIARGHVELTLSIGATSGDSFALNRQIVAGYIGAFRAAAQEFGIAAEPDLNAVLRLPGAIGAASVQMNGDTEASVLAEVEQAVERLNAMRDQEGRGIEQELRDRLGRLREAVDEIGRLRGVVLKAQFEKLQARMQELQLAQVEPERLLQEAALLSERSDIQEEIVRMTTHIEHFHALMGGGGKQEREVGKKMDFLLQEMNREANTLLSKTSGVVGEALRLTELGLAMKSEIEKIREQVQNIE